MLDAISFPSRTGRKSGVVDRSKIKDRYFREIFSRETERFVLLLGRIPLGIKIGVLLLFLLLR